MTERLAVFGVLALCTIAGNIADYFYRYLEELPDCSSELRPVIDLLYEIKAALSILDVSFQDPKFNRISRDLLDDIVLGVGSCSRSLRELDRIVSRYSSGRRQSSSRRAWNEIQSSFKDAEGHTLANRLDVHRTFLIQVKGILQYKADSRAQMARLQEQIRYLANNQERVTARMRELEESQRRAAEEKAYMARGGYPSPLPTPPFDGMVRRPYTPAMTPTYSPVDPTRYYAGPMMGDRPITPMTPISPISPLSPPQRDLRFSPPASTPSPMASPPMASPPLTQVPPNLRGGGLRPAWWTGVSGALRDPPSPSNSFREARKTDGSQCYGMAMESLNMAPEEVEVLKVEFDNDLTLRLFRNEVTEAAKVVCTVGPREPPGWFTDRRGAHKFQTFIDAALLSVTRVGHCLHLKRRNILWARLYFADVENMVLFYHTFLALRFYGPDSPTPKQSEYWLDGEELKFSGEIEDEGFVHYLRVLQDRDSGVVRLASVERIDDKTEVTVWTSFITESLLDHKWMHYMRSNMVLLRSFRQFSFSSCFDTSMSNDYVLRFRKPGDGRSFQRVIKEIRNGMQGYF